MSISNRGKFITFEGIDGCGKSTQVEMLVAKLVAMDIDVISIREPGGNRISESIRDILLNHKTIELGNRTEALLMTASRAQITKDKILPALASETWVIADRYADSTLAYQGGGRKINVDWLKKLNQFATYETVPDLTFFIDITVEEGIRRQKAEKDRIEKAGVDFQKRTREMYLKIVETNPDRIIKIDGSRNIDAIHAYIWAKFKEKLL